MANYEPALRSNTFRVKDPNAFEKWINEGLEGELHVQPVQNPENGMILYGETDLPSHDDEGEEIDFTGILASHLCEKEVAVIMGIGQEKLRYLVGWALAIHSDGDVIEMNLQDIHQKATDKFNDCNIDNSW